MLKPIFFTEWLHGRTLNIKESLALALPHCPKLILVPEEYLHKAKNVEAEEDVLDPFRLRLVHEVDYFTIVTATVHSQGGAFGSNQEAKPAQ